MATFAVISGNTISNIIVADTKEIAEMLTKCICQEISPDKGITFEWTWNGTDFVAPIEPIVEEPIA